MAGSFAIFAVVGEPRNVDVARPAAEPSTTSATMKARMSAGLRLSRADRIGRRDADVLRRRGAPRCDEEGFFAGYVRRALFCAGVDRPAARPLRFPEVLFMRKILAKRASVTKWIRGNPAGFPDAAHKRFGAFCRLGARNGSVTAYFLVDRFYNL